MRLDAPLALAAVAASAALSPVADAAGVPAAEPRPLPHRISVDVHGPVALVQVTRALWPAGEVRNPEGEALLDVALPEHAALLDVEILDGGRWRAAQAADAARARDLYLDESKARGVSAATEPFDDSTLYRIRVTRALERLPLGSGAAFAKGGEPVTLRYRFSAIPDFTEGRNRLRFPAVPERMPVPADVTVALTAATDVDIAGVRTTFAGNGAHPSASGRASTRSGWEISWGPRDPPVPARAAAQGAPSLEGTVAAAALSPSESAVAFAVHGRAGRQAGPPSSVLFLIDRSRSVGLPGLSAERDIALRLLDALPPSTRFDALFFDRAVKRLFPMSRPATREAIGALEGEMVPDQMRNGTDLAGALREAAALLRREASDFAPRALVVLITDGALADDQDGAALDRALGALPGLDLSVAAFAVRVPEDDPVAPASRQALRGLVAARGGVARELRANEIDDMIPAALVALGRGGDVVAVRLGAAGHEHALGEKLAPGEGLAGVMRWSARAPRALDVEATVRGQRLRLPVRPLVVDAAWLRPYVRTGEAPATRFVSTPGMVALVEPVLRKEVPREAPIKGSMDRLVVRNTLSLAYMPRARACYMTRSGATAALRDLTGRVRVAIELVRGEVSGVNIESSTLNHGEVEACLRDGAFAIEVPRALHSDAPVTAILNLVFRPRPPEKKSDAQAEMEAKLSDQIDLVIEELHRSEQREGRESGKKE